MKLTTALFAFTGLAGLALGKAVIQNIGVNDEVVVPNSYIIIYKSSATPRDRKKHEEAINKKAKGNGKEGIIETIELDGFNGYIAKMTSSELKDVVNSDLVASIEKDTILNLTAVAAPSFGPLRKRAYIQQLNSPWGLARISQRSNKRGLDARYYYDTTTKAGINVYVLDTGIRTTHKEFSGRAVWGANFVPGSPNRDENGHGTHVAGTIGGKTFGVAKNCNLIAVKVCDKNGQTTASMGLQGLQWAVNHAKSKGLAKKSVINISITGDYSAAANSFIKAATDAGLTIVVSAGNKGDDASFYSPSSAPSAITVGASDADDWRTPWSNFGSSVDIFAPGTGILSSWHLSDSSSRYLSGTSMAAPHVAGLAAYFFSNERIEGYAAVTRRILDAAIKDSVIDAMGSSNRLAYNANGK
ncbi:peptidase S8/S53 domain-containing protein [Fusarium oxysporum Fo47]|uniref:Peptidase S8/S53 domain-containing protein n=1 Tax=Fusarium oxysporum Fo47 TaxID=660027 RepID=W9JEV1_FUSOX|nr:peptidase S8/S53 domain-containing protein [Fusarium oxysporum Fo47]EWZ28200.1 hypothetical protein FOZG_18084 [Fusarium oxysporum Fo47]WJG35770.1 peptidase S8/S53 domain-containing protein [Fusarium oxysporum Fo47]